MDKKCSVAHHVDEGETGQKRDHPVFRDGSETCALARQPERGARFQLGFMETWKEMEEAPSGGETINSTCSVPVTQ